MKPSIRNASLFEQPEPEAGRKPALVTRLRTAAPGTDAGPGAASALGGEAWPWHMVTPTRPLDTDANDAASSAWPTRRLYREAQRRRAIWLGDWLTAAIRAVRARARRLRAGYRRFRQAQETYRTLRQLDDRMLRDLGFTRDEIRSVAAEMASQAAPTRRLARSTLAARPSLFGLLFGN